MQEIRGGGSGKIIGQESAIGRRTANEGQVKKALSGKINAPLAVGHRNFHRISETSAAQSMST
jgi:hypothetical protein